MRLRVGGRSPVGLGSLTRLRRKSSGRLRKLFLLGVTVGMLPALLSVSVDASERPGTVEMVSVGPGGVQDRDSGFLSDCYGASYTSVSADGRFVAFASKADLVPGVDNGPVADVYVFDRRKKVMHVASASTSGEIPVLSDVQTFAGGCGATNPSLDGKGRYVAFASDAALTPEDRNLGRDIYVRDLRQGTTELVSVSSKGEQAPGTGRDLTISHDGRLVAFRGPPELDPDACSVLDEIPGISSSGCGRTQLLVRDRATRKTWIASVGSDGRPISEGIVSDPSFDAKGRLLLFSSDSNDLRNEPRARPDVYLHDLRSGETELISEIDGRPSQAPIAGSATQTDNSITDDGRFVLFHTDDPRFVPNDSGLASNLFVRDRSTGRVERVDVTHYGGENVDGGYGAISGDGRFVVMVGFAENPGHYSGCEELCYGVLVHDRLTGSTEVPFITGSTYSDGYAWSPNLNRNGRYLALVSKFGFVPEDTNDLYDVYLVDRGNSLGVGRADTARRTSSRPLIVTDPETDAATSHLGSAGELTGGRVVARPQFRDVFVNLELREMPRTPLLAAITAGAVFGAEFDVAGVRYVVRVVSTGLDAGGGTTARFGLFRCSRPRHACAAVTEIRGGFGTSGERITFAIPWAAFGRGVRVDAIRLLRLYSALGSYDGGIERILDSAKAGRG